MTYKDSTDDDIESEVLDFMPQKDFDLAEEAERLETRLEILGDPGASVERGHTRLALGPGEINPFANRRSTIGLKKHTAIMRGCSSCSTPFTSTKCLNRPVPTIRWLNLTIAA